MKNMKNLIMITDPIFFSLASKWNLVSLHKLVFGKPFKGNPFQGSRVRGIHTGATTVVPVVVYSNPDLDKEKVIKENKGKSGVYRWTNLISGKTYVGSSVSLGKRFGYYYNYSYLIHPVKNKMAINKALLKYGYSNFKLEILEYCELKDVIKREQHYMDLLKPEYNILKTAGSTLGYRHTEETLSKLRGRGLSKNIELNCRII